MSPLYERQGAADNEMEECDGRANEITCDVMQNHPLTGIPCFWVHPCNTNAAMGELIGASASGSRVTAVEYLMLWLGLAGAAVGLHLPRWMASLMTMG